jgi:hypothetical protein
LNELIDVLRQDAKELVLLAHRRPGLVAFGLDPTAVGLRHREFRLTIKRGDGP